MGSTYFFSCYSDFNGRDIDEIEIIETTNFQHMRHFTGKGKCLFQLRKKPFTQNYIDDALKSNLGMVVGKFLIPEFCQEIGLEIEELSQLRPLIDKLDEKHRYEEIIYNSYISNGAFFLTEEQRFNAYESYKLSRGEKNG